MTGAYHIQLRIAYAGGAPRHIGVHREAADQARDAYSKYSKVLPPPRPSRLAAP